MSAGDPPPVSEDVRRLLIERVGGFEELEVLLLLAREPSRAWSSADAATALGLAEHLVGPALAALVDGDLVAVTAFAESFRFAPATPVLARACAELAALHQQDRFRVVGLMAELAFERIRRATTRAFADAFLIRHKKKKEDG